VARGPGLLSSLKHRDFRLLMFAFSGSSIGSWAYNVALAVWIFEETGSPAWVGAATIARMVPAFLFSPYGGVVADRYERVRLMVVLDVLGAVLMVALAVETALGLPVLVVIATAVVNSALSTAYEPAVAALTPQLVGERDLGSANALRNTIDNAAVVVGPGLGAIVLLFGSPPLAIAVNSLSYGVSAVLVARMRQRSEPVDVTEGGEAGAFRQMLVGIKAITSSPVAGVLVAYSVVATLVFGIDTVLFVVLSRDLLGTGAEGYGYLLAGLGVGGGRDRAGRRRRVLAHGGRREGLVVRARLLLLTAHCLRRGPRQAAGEHAGACGGQQERAGVATRPAAYVVEHAVSVLALQPVGGLLDLLRHLAHDVGADAARELAAAAHALQLAGQ